MIITSELLDDLGNQAKQSPRLRMHFDLRNTESDKSQRMLNAFEPGTIVPVHRHIHSSETIIVLRGKIKQNLYDDCGKLESSDVLSATSSHIGFNVPKGKWHNTECIESGTVVFAAQDGPYENKTFHFL